MRRRKKRKTKSDFQRAHAKRRFSERFGIDLNRNLRRDFVTQIQEGEAEFIEKQSNRVSVFGIQYEGNYLRIVYDKQRHNIVTVLFSDEEYQERCEQLSSNT